MLVLFWRWFCFVFFVLVKVVSRITVQLFLTILTHLQPFLVTLNPSKSLKKLTAKCSRYSWDDCEWIGNLVGAWRFKEVMPKAYMGTPKKYKFEDTVIYGSEDADAYLTNLYGDWRKLPPEEKRVTHHDYIECDLNRSYLRD